MIIVYIVVIVIVIGLWYLQTPNGKGWLGEKRVDTILKSLAKRLDGYPIWDLLLGEEDKSSQIDNILITPKGIYVIEVKNYSGWIYGDSTKKDWYQTIKHVNKYKRKNGSTYTKTHMHKDTFFSPVLQNVTHIKRILAPVGDIDLPVYNIVVFGNRAELKAIRVVHKNVFVMNTRDLKRVILGIEKKHHSLWDIEKVQHLGMFLEHKDNSSFINKYKHVKRVKAKHK